jgi:hypothetical protein
LKKPPPQSVNYSTTIPADQLCIVLSEICIPVAGRRIVQLQIHRDPSIVSTDQLMMEFELCIGLIFKPLRHHIHHILQCNSGGSSRSSSISSTSSSTSYLPVIWLSVLSVLEDLLCDKTPVLLYDNEPTPMPNDEYNSSHYDTNYVVVSDDLKATMNSLVNEHLQSAIQILLSMGVLRSDPSDGVDPGDIVSSVPSSNWTTDDTLTKQTWESVSRMGISDADVQQWKQQAVRASKVVDTEATTNTEHSEQ